jgi:hypothetical protein
MIAVAVSRVVDGDASAASRIGTISYFGGAEIIAISWLAPFGRAMYVQFHPDMYRLPPCGSRGHGWRRAGRCPCRVRDVLRAAIADQLT